MFVLITVRGNKSVSAEFSNIGDAREALSAYNAAREAVKRRNAAAVVRFGKAYNAAAAVGKAYLFSGKRPKRERVPAEVMLYGFEEAEA